MNHEIHNKELFISWQGQVTGPYSLKDIQNLLKLGKIHSLYKVQAEGQWILLRDHLAVLEKKSREEAAKQLVIASQPQPSSASAFKPVDLADDDVEPVEVSDPTHVPRLSNAGREASVPAGIAITSFVLSLFFFIPFLNGITWLLALIFGYLSCQFGKPSNRQSRHFGLGGPVDYLCGNRIFPIWSRMVRRDGNFAHDEGLFPASWANAW